MVWIIYTSCHHSFITVYQNFKIRDRRCHCCCPRQASTMQDTHAHAVINIEWSKLGKSLLPAVTPTKSLKIHHCQFTSWVLSDAYSLKLPTKSSNNEASNSTRNLNFSYHIWQPAHSLIPLTPLSTLHTSGDHTFSPIL